MATKAGIYNIIDFKQIHLFSTQYINHMESKRIYFESMQLHIGIKNAKYGKTAHHENEFFGRYQSLTLMHFDSISIIFPFDLRQLAAPDR